LFIIFVIQMYEVSEKMSVDKLQICVPFLLISNV